MHEGTIPPLRPVAIDTRDVAPAPAPERPPEPVDIITDPQQVAAAIEDMVEEGSIPAAPEPRPRAIRWRRSEKR
jgi:hypothetical protein